MRSGRKKANTPFVKVTFDENKLKEIVSDVVKNIEFNLNSVKSEVIKEFADRLCDGRVSNDPVVIAVKVELEMTEVETNQRKEDEGK